MNAVNCCGSVTLDVQFISNLNDDMKLPAEGKKLCLKQRKQIARCGVRFILTTSGWRHRVFPFTAVTTSRICALWNWGGGKRVSANRRLSSWWDRKGLLLLESQKSLQARRCPRLNSAWMKSSTWLKAG